MRLTTSATPEDSGAFCCSLDHAENAPFGSVGGLDARPNLTAPSYVATEDAEEWLNGYTSQARRLYGEDWATCEFRWGKVLEV